MVEIVMNERAWCEDALENLNTKTMHVAVSRLARYYYSIGCRRPDVVRKLEDYLIRCDKHVGLAKWQDYIERCVDNMDKRPLVDVEYIPITQKEIDIIEKNHGISERKVLFCLLCLAKYLTEIDERNHYWCRFGIKDIFALANVNINTKRRGMMLSKFRDEGLITFSKIVDNTNMHIEYADETGEPVMKITDARNLGYQYMAMRYDGYIRCRACGLVVKRTGPAQKYCPECAISVDYANRTVRRRSLNIPDTTKIDTVRN